MANEQDRPTMQVRIEGFAETYVVSGALVAYLDFGDDNAEVQLMQLGDRIVVVAAGDVDHRVDVRGFHHLSVFPSRKPTPAIS